jgi:hypothetical protein
MLLVCVEFVGKTDFRSNSPAPAGQRTAVGDVPVKPAQQDGHLPGDVSRWRQGYAFQRDGMVVITFRTCSGCHRSVTLRHRAFPPSAST